ncbi:hypothetical protein J5N97_020437 [Dioscorea zingiberensis]|uniref:Disease resistance protein At4g27190-like leucine-rich repeats domain-containing protein n=1 Tax=Dioscorea zingiberensis TaxID=325984 RepID=A0A9D5CFV4_9LILI|nr:hypothetical protein J5N97_020437 [Dioscorea zingiberensis]
MDILTNIAGGLVQNLWVPIGRQCGYLIFYKSKVSKLQSKFSELDLTRKDIQQDVDAAVNQRLEEVTNEVQSWLSDVETVEKEVDSIVDRIKDTNKGLLECIPVVFLCYRLGRDSANKIETIDNLLKNGKMSRIPDQFFSQLGSLLVLDLSATSISALPKSVSCLTNLKALKLECCQSLRDVSRIKELKKLEILDLGQTQLRFFPKEAGFLIHLRCLDLTATTASKTLASFVVGIPYKTDHSTKVLANILSKLGSLEQLFMDNFDADFGELARLTQLTHLFVHVENSANLSLELGSSQLWDKLTNFCICFVPRIRNHSHSLSKHGRTLHMNRTKDLAGWVKMLLERTRSLELFDLLLSSGDTDFPATVFSNLEHLRVDGWTKLTEFCGEILPEGALGKLRDMSVVSCPMLRRLMPRELWTRMNQLKKLTVEDCPEMLQLFPYTDEMVEEKEKPSSSTLQDLGVFQSLRTLHVISCPRLTYLFLLKQADGMRWLEELHVEDCATLQGIVFYQDNEEDHQRLFPLLKKLRLTSLPELTDFYYPVTLACYWPSPEYLEISSCPKLQPRLMGPQTSH